MTFSSSMKLVIVTISVSGRSALIRPIAVTPSMFGISRSIRTTSGSSRRAIATPSLPSDGLADDLDVVLEVEEHAQAHPDDRSGRRRAGRGCGAASSTWAPGGTIGPGGPGSRGRLQSSLARSSSRGSGRGDAGRREMTASISSWGRKVLRE